MSYFSERLPGKVEPSPEAGTEILLAVVDRLSEWRIRSVPAFRKVLLGEGGLMANPVVDWGENDDVMLLVRGMQKTVREGRLIDFGYIPNEMIKAESIRARPAFEGHELMLPFDDWIAISAWEGGMVAYYFMKPKEPPHGIICVEIYGVSIPALPGLCPAHDSFLLYDGCGVNVIGPEETRVTPLPFIREDIEPNEKAMSMRGANSLDPLVTFLRFLNDASCPVEVVKAPEKLNRARAKKGKAPIPGHFTVPARDYITRLRAEEVAQRALQPGREGGTHASPAPHWRRSHRRLLPSGKLIPVRASKVNFRSVDEMKRLFYTVKLGGK